MCIYFILKFVYCTHIDYVSLQTVTDINSSIEKICFFISYLVAFYEFHVVLGMLFLLSYSYVKKL